MAELHQCEVVEREDVGMIILLDLKELARGLTECSYSSHKVVVDKSL